MATVKQREANQRNAQFSTGPKTQEGKERSDLNPITHGLRTKVVEVLPTKTANEFVVGLESMFRDYAPEPRWDPPGPPGSLLLTWKIDRANRHEIAQLSEQVVNAVRPCLNDPKIPTDQMNEVFVDAAALASFDASNEGERLRRYQVSLQNALFRTLNQLGPPRNLDAQEATTTLRPRRSRPNRRFQSLRLTTRRYRWRTSPARPSRSPARRFQIPHAPDARSIRAEQSQFARRPT